MSAYEKGRPGHPGTSLGVRLKMVWDSKPVKEKSEKKISQKENFQENGEKRKRERERER